MLGVVLICFSPRKTEARGQPQCPPPPSQAPGPSQGRPSPCRLSMAKLTAPRVLTQPQVLTVGCPLPAARQSPGRDSSQVL